MLKFNKRKQAKAKQQEPAPKELLQAFGGRENIVTIGACMTRLRIGVKEPGLVQQAQLQQMGAAAVVQIGHNMQAVFGAQADQLRGALEAYLEHLDTSDSPQESMQQAATSTILSLGGTGNIFSAQFAASSRIRVELSTPLPPGTSLNNSSYIQAVMPIKPKLIHLIIGDKASQLADEMNAQLANEQPQISV